MQALIIPDNVICQPCKFPSYIHTGGCIQLICTWAVAKGKMGKIVECIARPPILALCQLWIAGVVGLLSLRTALSDSLSAWGPLAMWVSLRRCFGPFDIVVWSIRGSLAFWRGHLVALKLQCCKAYLSAYTYLPTIFISHCVQWKVVALPWGPGGTNYLATCF